MQINLFEEHRELTEVLSNCWLIPEFFSLESQKDLLLQTRHWCKGLFHQPPIPGTNLKLAHPIACVGYDWIPYEYRKPKVAMPEYLQQLYYDALLRLPDTECYLREFELHKPDTAVINWFPPGSSLGMHVDKSEDERVRSLGNPIVTIALGATADISIGGYAKSDATIKIRMQSGDVLVMHSKSRMRYHSVAKIYTNTSELEKFMKSVGRISITIRRAKI